MLIYYYDENNTYTHSDLIGDDAVMPANATKVAPLDGNGAGTLYAGSGKCPPIDAKRRTGMPHILRKDN